MNPASVNGRHVWECATCHGVDVFDGIPTRGAPSGWWPTVAADEKVLDYTCAEAWLCPQCAGAEWHAEARYWRLMAKDLERQRAIPVGRGFGSRRPR